MQKFVTYNDRLNNERKSLKVQLTNIIEQRKLKLQSMSSNLKAVSPLAVLDRGYAIVMNNKGKPQQQLQRLCQLAFDQGNCHIIRRAKRILA